MAKFTNSDRYGMYRTLDQDGPGPALMGAHTLLGNDVVNGQDESLGDIKEIMLDMRTGRVACSTSVATALMAQSLITEPRSCAPVAPRFPSPATSSLASSRRARASKAR